MVAKLPPSAREMVAKVLNALRKNDAATIEQLLHDGMHPDLKLAGSTGTKRAVTLAVSYEDPRIFDLYVRYGADMNMPVVGANNPLFLSVSRGDERGVMRSLAAGADVSQIRNRGSKQKDHVMHLAAAEGNPEVTRLLLDAGGWKALDNRNNSNLTPAGQAKAMLRARPKEQQDRAATLDLLEGYAALPRLDFKQKNFDKATLSRTDDKGLCPLEHPETWERWDEVCAVLAERGERFEKADLLATNAEGVSWLERATSCFALGKVVKQLNAQAEAVTHDDLLQDGEANPLLSLVRHHRQVGALMTADNCRHWNGSGVRAVCAQLDDYEREAFVPNAHQLAALANQYENQRSGSVRGR